MGMSTVGIYWIAAIVVFSLVEAATAGLTSIWFALGSVAGLCTALLGGPVWLQVVWFLVISAATLILTRPLAKKYVNGRRQPTNADRLIGETGTVTEGIDNIAAKGTVNMGGQLWTARSLTGAVLPAGTLVTAREIQGVKLIVEKAGEHEEKKEE